MANYIFKYIILKVFLLTVTFLLNGCYATTGIPLFGTSSVSVNPDSSSDIKNTSDQLPLANAIQKEIEVIVPIFDPNIPKDPNTWEKKGVWPELRRVESIKFALKMKEALEDTKQLGAVRVAPDRKVIGDLYVIGKINESNGEDININIKVVSIDGKSWLDRNYKYRVSSRFFTSIRNKDKNPYDPLFKQAAKDIVEILQSKDKKYLKTLNQLTEVRYGYSMSNDSFAKYLKFKGEQVELVRLPSDNDPMFKRIHQFWVEDRLFIDRMQQHYQDFNKKTEDSYKVWQEAALSATKAKREARKKAILQALSGVVALGLGEIAHSNNLRFVPWGSAAAGTFLLYSSIRTYKEAKFHQDTLLELGQSIDIEVAPQVLEFEEKTIKLTGNSATQFNQWRMALKKIYSVERSPDKPL